MNAQQKRDQQQAEYERRRAEEQVASDEAKKRWPAIAKEQRRKAIEQINKAVEEAHGTECKVVIWELDRRLEASVFNYVKKQGYNLLIQYTSAKEDDYDGRPTGRTLMGVILTINWR